MHTSYCSNMLNSVLYIRSIYNCVCIIYVGECTVRTVSLWIGHAYSYY